MKALQVLVTVVSILVTGGLLVRQLRRASKRIRLRPRLDIARIVIQFGSVILIAVLLGAGAPILALVFVGLFAVGPGYVQGRNLEISDDDGRLYAVRNTVAASVWGVGLVIMQLAGLLKRTGILGLGQATAWVGVGLAVGLMIGRHRPLTEYRRSAGRAVAPVAAVIIVLLAVIAFGDGRQAEAQDSGRWVQVDEQVNPNGDPSPDRWVVELGANSVSVVQSFGPDDTDGGEATFDATWEAPAATLIPGEPLVIPVTASGRNTGNLDTQYFFGIDVIMIVNGRWNNEAVGADANCAQTTVISGVYECSEPVTNMGEMVTTVPTFGDQFTIGVGALNCGGACYVEWTYEFEQDPSAGDSTDDPPEGVIYELVETTVNPGNRGEPLGSDSVSASSMQIQVSSNTTNPSAPTGIYDITWSGPPDTVTGGTTATLAVNVAASLTGDSDPIAEYIDMRLWLIEANNFDDVPAFLPACGAPCSESWGSPTLMGTSSVDMVFDVPENVEEFTITLQAVCDQADPDAEYGPCAVQWRYEAAGGSPVGAVGGASDTDQLEDFIEEQSDDTGIEPDEAMQAALAGVLAALATGGISLLEAMEQVTRIFEEGSTIERRPPIADPVTTDHTGVDDEFVEQDEASTESARRTGSEFEEDIADYVRTLPPPGEGVDIGPYLDWLQQMAQAASEQGAHWQRPFDPAEFGRVWDAIGGVSTNPTAATADELRHALADLLDRDIGGVPTWLVSWAARNPAAAGEMLVRMGAAYATGGASELALIPWDVNRDITSAGEAAARRGEPFEFGDAVMAGAHGQVIGWVVDGAGAAANSSRRAAGETLAEIAARTEARVAGEGLEGAAESLARSTPDADDLLDASRRNTDPDGWRGIDNEPPGSKIPPEHIRQTGYTPEQARELQRVAAEQNVLIGTRQTNLDATRWIEAGDAIPKPMAVKAKTVNELDALIGGPPADKKGLVGFFEPTEPKMPRQANPELWERFDARRTEWEKLKPEMDMMQAAGYEVRDGVVSKVMPDGTTMPFAGDIDAVAILDAKTGKPVSGARYQEVVDELKNSGARLQHGAETNVVNDIVAHETAGLTPGTREYNEAFDTAMDKATKLGDKLDQNHLDGKEQVFWTHARGHYRGPQVRTLGDWQAMTAGEIPTRITDPVEFAAAMRPVTQAIDNDE